jgi:hypothetical protein
MSANRTAKRFVFLVDGYYGSAKQKEIDRRPISIQAFSDIYSVACYFFSFELE